MMELKAGEYRRFEDIKHVREDVQSIGVPENLPRRWSTLNGGIFQR